MRALVTGATGFVGSHVARLLCDRGDEVRILARPTSRLDLLKGLPVDVALGDLTDPPSVERAVAGCAHVYHVAADYRLWTPDPKLMVARNVEGTRTVLEAAARAGASRIVYTSTVGALGIPGHGGSGTEETPVSLADMVGHYKRSKYLAERVALDAAQNGVPVVVVNPSTPVGPGDIKPTPTGQMIVDFLNGRMPAYIDTGLNLIAVEDVAAGHLLAAERGTVGRKYILGHRNLTLREILERVAAVSGLKAPGVRMPYAVAFAAACAENSVARLRHRTPSIPIEGVRMARKKMYFDASRAVRELGLPQTPVEDALARAVTWFRDHGYVRKTAPVAATVR